MLERARLVRDLVGAPTKHEAAAITRAIDATTPLKTFTDDYRAGIERDNMKWLATLSLPATKKLHETIKKRLELSEDRLVRGKHKIYAMHVATALQEFVDAIK